MKVLVTGCGGSMGMDVAWSLRQANRNYRIIGTDSERWSIAFGERLCDRVHAVPRSADPSFVGHLLQIIRDEAIDVAIVNPDAEIETIARERIDLAVPVCTPRPDVALVCLDKEQTFQRLIGRVPSPATIVVTQTNELASALETIGSPIWFRPATGAGGRGSILVHRQAHAAFWMEYWDELGYRGPWLAQEYLPGRNFNWSSLWFDGTLIASICMERVEYVLGKAALSGVTGEVALCRTVDQPAACETGEAAVRGVDERPHGFYSVDMRENRQGQPCLNEINARMAGRPRLFTSAGVNFPDLFCQLATGQTPEIRPVPRTGLWLARRIGIDPLVRDDSFVNAPAISLFDEIRTMEGP